MYSEGDPSVDAGLYIQCTNPDLCLPRFTFSAVPCEDFSPPDDKNWKSGTSEVTLTLNAVQVQLM